jgi:SAM-dependent methyltransferase
MDPQRIPPQVYPYLLGLAGFQEAYALASYVGDARRVLIVGETSGRDYYYQTALGKHVVALDILRNLHVPNMIQANAERPLPFPDASFDAVIISEVLEHLYNDIGTLAEIRRVLTDDGVLAVSVPFWSDTPFHARIHTRRTIQSLVEYSGFEITAFYERGALLGLTGLIVAWCALTYHARRLLRPGVNRVEHYFNILRRISDFNLAHRIPRIWPTSKHHGCYLAARKGPYRDFIEVQAVHFKQGGTVR